LRRPTARAAVAHHDEREPVADERGRRILPVAGTAQVASARDGHRMRAKLNGVHVTLSMVSHEDYVKRNLDSFGAASSYLRPPLRRREHDRIPIIPSWRSWRLGGFSSASRSRVYGASRSFTHTPSILR